MSLKSLIPNVAALARTLGVSDNTVWRWIALDAVPPARALDVARALGIEAHEILPYARRRYTPTKIHPKTPGDLDTLLAAYRGEPYETTMSAPAVKHALAYWGDRIPLLHKTLTALSAREISLDEAAAALEITKSAVNQMRRRYGVAPGRRRKVPADTSVSEAKGSKKKRCKHGTKIPATIYDVISGRQTVVEAAYNMGVSKRTLYRHVTEEMEKTGVNLNAISHWSPSFRHALAVEIERNEPKISLELREFAEKRGIPLKKSVKRPQKVVDYRAINTRTLMIDWLMGDKSVEELAALRGGEPHMIEQLFESQLQGLGLFRLPSLHHRAAVGELLMAMDGHYRVARASE